MSVAGISENLRRMKMAMKLADNINNRSAIEAPSVNELAYARGLGYGYGYAGRDSYATPSANAVRIESVAQNIEDQAYCTRALFRQAFTRAEQNARLCDRIAEADTRNTDGQFRAELRSTDAWDKRRKSIVRNQLIVKRALDDKSTDEEGKAGRDVNKRSAAEEVVARLEARQLRAQEDILAHPLKFVAEGLLSRVERQKAVKNVDTISQNAVKCSLDMSSNQPSKEDAQGCAIDQLVSNVDLKWYQYALLSMVVVSVLLWKPVLVIVWAVMFAATFLIKEKEVVAYNCLERIDDLSTMRFELKDRDIKYELEELNMSLRELTHQSISSSMRYTFEKSIELCISMLTNYKDSRRNDCLLALSKFKETVAREIDRKKKIEDDNLTVIINTLNDIQ